MVKYYWRYFIMRKVELRTMEERKYEIIKNLVDHNGNKKRAAMKLNISIRQINRLIKIYLEKGKIGFVHGNRNRKPINTISDELKETITELYKTKYTDANIRHFTNLLEEYEGIKISYSTVYLILRKQHILSPKLWKKTSKYEAKLIKKSMKEKIKLSEEQKDLIVKNNILDKYDAHSRIERLKYFGECLEMDASKEYWINGIKWTLHGAIDNATGAICGLYFDYEETLNGYYHLLERIWRKFGVPAKFLTDNRTVFVYNGLKEKSLEKDTLTQFGYACKILGIDLETTSIPEKKSRIERLWETLQSRLPIELRIHNITTIEDANLFLLSYIDKFNKEFSLPINYTTSVFEMVDTSLINQTLSIISKRRFDKGCSIKYNNKYYLTYIDGQRMNYCNGTRCLVIKTYDGRLLCNVDDQLSELYELEDHVQYSKEFDFIEEKNNSKKKGRYIPPITHPWKGESFKQYLYSIKRYESTAYI